MFSFDLLMKIMKILEIAIPLPTPKNLPRVFAFHRNKFPIRLVGPDRNVQHLLL